MMQMIRDGTQKGPLAIRQAPENVRNVSTRSRAYVA